MNETMVQILTPIAMAVAGLVGTAIAYGCKKLGDYIAAKTKIETSRDLAARLGVYAAEAVTSVGQSFVDGCKKASEDGKLTREEAIEAAYQALHQVRDSFGSKWSDFIKDSGGYSVAESRVENAVEAAVARKKNLT